LPKAPPGKNILEPNYLLPGEFRGNLKLETDARRIVLPGLGAFAKCSDITKVTVVDVKQLTPPSAKGWSETWTAAACGKTVEATVAYVVIEGGMNIVASDWKVR
jgi:hypothetical protein